VPLPLRDEVFEFYDYGIEVTIEPPGESEITDVIDDDLDYGAAEAMSGEPDKA
jgi:hypothetical protein